MEESCVRMPIICVPDICWYKILGLMPYQTLLQGTTGYQRMRRSKFLSSGSIISLQHRVKVLWGECRGRTIGMDHQKVWRVMKDWSFEAIWHEECCLVIATESNDEAIYQLHQPNAVYALKRCRNLNGIVTYHWGSSLYTIVSISVCRKHWIM